MNRFSEILKVIESRRDEPNRFESFERFQKALRSRNYNFNPKKTIMIAGTNGKGSTAKALQAFISAQGLRVGLFTSPHLIETTERIRIDGKPISREQFVTAYDNLEQTVLEFGLSHFETLTLMACEIFFGSGSGLSFGTNDLTTKQPFDWTIFEVGVGGLLDPTKAIPHSTSVIAKLGLDHQKILGDTLAEIARHKFGIVDKGNLVFHLPFDASLEIEKLKAQGEWRVCPSFKFRIEKVQGEPMTILQTLWGEAALDLPGARGAENVSLALQVFQGLGFDPATVLKTCAQIGWPARMEKFISGSWPCPVYLSGDHNLQGIESLVSLLQDYDYQVLHLIVGIGAGKDSISMLKVLRMIPRVKIYFTQTTFRGQSLEDAYGEHLSAAEFTSLNPLECLERALRLAQPRQIDNVGDIVLMTGSLYMVGTVRAALLSKGAISCQDVRHE